MCFSGCEFVSLRGRQRRGVAQSCVPFWMCQLASGPICVGHSLLDQHFSQRDRERKLYSRVMRFTRARRMVRATCFSLCSTASFFFFSPAVVSHFLCFSAIVFVLTVFLFPTHVPPFYSTSPALVCIAHHFTKSSACHEIRSLSLFFFNST